MKTAKKILSVVLAMVIGLGSFALITSAETSEHLTEIPEGYVGVYTIEDLYCIRNDLTANYILMNDIDLTEALADGGIWNVGTGWQPIGVDRTTSHVFKGTFDGNNYTLFGLRFCEQTEFTYTGLFGRNSGVIKNLNLKDFNVTGSSMYLGLICAENSGEIKNIHATGTINTYFDVGGGIAGINSGKITDCHINVNSTISRSDDFCYGLICGENQSTATISCCSASGTGTIASKGKSSSSSASVSSYTYVGGIAGINAGEIEQSFNKSTFDATATASFSWSFSTTITGTRYYYYFSNSNSTIGGIAASNTGTINNCYNTGYISIVGSYSYESGSSYSAKKPTANAGGIAGLNTNGTIGYCYNFAEIGCSGAFNVSAQGDLSASGNSSNTSYYLSTGTSTSGTSLSETMFGVVGCFSHFDFNNIWFIDKSEGVNRPQLISNPEAVHKHQYTSKVTTPATHTSTGVMTYTCDCGDTYTETIPSVKHDYKAVVTEPTCTDKGYTTYTCICGDTYVDDYVNASGHTYTSKVTTPATHTSTGVMTYTCECGDAYTETIAKLTEHNYSAVVTEPTCTDKGYTTYTCICGDTYVDDYVNASGHTYTSKVTTPATHTSTGVKTYTCECGDAYTETIAKLTEHNYNAVVTKPTCTKQGYTTYTCECGDSYKADYKGYTGHDYDSGIVTTKPTCTKAGVRTFTCANCGDTYTEEIGANGHSHISRITTPATHLNEGVKTYSCACGDTYTETIAKLTEHNHVAVVTVPTCTKQGFTTYTCECGDTYVDDYVDASGHSHSAEITVPATHTSVGVMTYTCDCGDVYTETIAKLTEHNHVAVVTAPTCTEQGFTTYTCECGDTYVDDYVDATGHSDTDNDGNCNDCVEHLCDHACHKSGFAGFFWKITRFFSKLFGTNKVCECGNAHY